MELCYSCPGKVLLLGEYSVLTGKPAIVATVPPHFKLYLRGSSQVPPHARSPVARLRRWAAEQGWPDLPFDFEDPYRGAGGFGASTAQFVLAYRAYLNALGSNETWKDLLKLYRELMADEPLVPSGADLVAQWEGGTIHFNPTAGTVSELKDFRGENLLIFSATQLPGRKVPTHEHLNLLSRLGFPKNQSKLLSTLEAITQDGLSAILNCAPIDFGKAMDEYANALHEANLEVEGAFEDRKALRSLPGVLGVKGAGALQSDALIVAVEPNSDMRRHIIEAATQRGLVLNNDGIRVIRD
jgi:mevalonate kinase